MALHYANLDENTRSFMLSEVDLDLSHEKLYMSPRLNEPGEQNYVSLLKEAIEHHDDAWLAEQLRIRGYMKEDVQRKKRGGGFTTVRVPKNAPDTLSEGEFNRYYARGLCVRVIEEGMDQVEVCPGKRGSKLRQEFGDILGEKLSAETLLEDLRKSSSVDSALGLLRRSNSGLTIRMERIEGITKIVVQGFKSIAERRAIDICPLTIIAGANSSGKSSIMQPLLMLKQTLEAPYDPGPLLLDGPNVQFTSISQFLSKCSHPDLASGLIREKGTEHFQIEIETDQSYLVKTTFEKGQSRIELAKMTIERYSSYLPTGGFTLYPGMPSEEIKSLADQDPMLKDLGKDFDVVKRLGCFLGLESRDGHRGLNITHDLALNLVNSIHLPGLRGNPERTYKLTSTGPQYPGRFENYVASIIHEWQENTDERLEMLAEVLHRLGLTGQVGTEKIGDTSIELRVGRLPDDRAGETDMVSIADVGFGVSQVLPVLVALIVAEPGRLVYLEQPELHLHPRAQVALARVLADAAKRGVRVVVETHSSLLLLAVQTLVAEGYLPRVLVKLHWFKRDDNGATEIKTAELDEAGAYGDWPEDFDDVDLKAQSDYLDATDRVAFGNKETL